MSSRVRLLIIIFVVAIVVIVGGSLLYANLSKTTISKSSNTLPIRSDNPNVTSVVALYTFSGKVASISNDSITLKSNDPPLPEFKITARTPVFLKSNENKPTRSTQDELKKMPNPDVNLTVAYDFKTGNWSVTNILLNTAK